MGGRLSGMAMAMLRPRMKADLTVHGFRSGVRDWSAYCAIGGSAGENVTPFRKAKAG